MRRHDAELQPQVGALGDEPREIGQVEVEAPMVRGLGVRLDPLEDFPVDPFGDTIAGIAQLLVELDEVVVDRMPVLVANAEDDVLVFMKPFPFVGVRTFGARLECEAGVVRARGDVRGVAGGVDGERREHEPSPVLRLRPVRRSKTPRASAGEVRGVSRKVGWLGSA
jgi:hypothetical protein